MRFTRFLARPLPLFHLLNKPAPAPAPPRSTYCSKECQAAAWVGVRSAALTTTDSHRAFCAKLLPPPAPLRLVSRGVAVHHLALRGWVPGEGRAAAVRAPLPVGEGVSVSGAWEPPAAKALAPLRAALARLGPAPQRLLLLLMTPWQTPFPAGGPDEAPRWPIFSVALPIDAEELVRAVVRATRYIFAEEDRVCNAKYSSGPSMPCVGMEMPPTYAARMGATLDAAGRVTSVGPFGLGGSTVFMGPTSLRWATPQGPFRIGEMCMTDLLLSELSFLPLTLLGREAGRAEEGAWLCAATFEA